MKSLAARNPWIIGRHCLADPVARLICVPQAGAGAGAFSGWRGRLPAGVELTPVELPGRGTRLGEPMPASFAALADALFAGIRAELDRPYALFGHSLGGSLAYEVAIRVQRHGLPAPAAVLISGSRAPHVPSLRTMSDVDDEVLLRWLNRNGGLPAQLLADPSFLREITRVIRADLGYAEAYVAPDPPVLRCPLHVFGGEQDEITPPAELPRWRRCAGAEFSVTMLPGGHSFPHEDPAAMIAAIARRAGFPVGTGWGSIRSRATVN